MHRRLGIRHGVSPIVTKASYDAGGATAIRTILNRKSASVEAAVARQIFDGIALPGAGEVRWISTRMTLVWSDRAERFVLRTWQVQDAKTRLSEVIERARTEGPQTITRHGTDRAVVLSIEDYRKLVAYKPDFKAHLLGGPKVDDFFVERDRDAGRALEL